jgi:WD domain, G-beta repeat
MAHKETTSIDWEILMAALVTTWESEGYVLGTDKYIQLNALLKQIPPSISTAQLKTLIAPIIAQNAQQQEEFYRLFNIVLQQVITMDLSHKTIVKQEAKNIVINDFKYKTFNFVNKQLDLINPKILKISLFIGAFVLFGLSVFFYLYTKNRYKDLKDSADVGEYRHFCFPIEKGDTYIDYKQKAQTIKVFGINTIGRNVCIDYVPERLGKDELTISMQRSNGSIEAFTLFISAFKIRNIVYSKPSPRGIKGQTLTFKPQINNKDSLNSFTSVNDSTQKENVGGQYIEGISSTWELGFGNSYFSREKGLIVLISLCLVALMGLFWRYKNQKFTLKFNADSHLPSSWTIRIPNSATVLMDEKFYIAVSEMRKRDINDSKRIDVKKTINASINNGGMIEFNYLQTLNTKNYLVLIDINSDANHRAKLHEFIIKSLLNHDVPIDYFYFNNDIQFCWNDTIKGITISELRHKYGDYQLIIFSNGASLIDTNSGALNDWTNVFDAWRKKIILTPRIPKDWDNREAILAQKFRILPANTEGVAALVETLEAVEAKAYTLWIESKNQEKTIDILDNMNAEALYVFLESTFIVHKNGLKDDRILQWIAACALPPVPFWDWTLYVGELLNEAGNPCLTLPNLFKLSQLNWFIEGKIPNNYRGLLIKWLEINHPYFLIKLINEWSYVLKLETNLPPEGSIAWQGHRVQVVLNDLLKQSSKEERRKLELELDNLLEGEAVKDALVVHYLDGRSSLLDNMLSDNFRKFIQTKKSILWRWRDWTWQLPIVLSVFLLTLFIHYSEPVTTFNFDNNITALNFLADGKSFLIANQEGKIGICDDNRWIQSVDTKYNIVDLATSTINNEPIVSAVNNKGDLMLWNQLQGTSDYDPITTLKNINCAAISTDLKRLIVGYYTTNNAQLWDVEKKTFISFSGHKDAITDVAISADQQFIMTASRDNTAKLWSIKGGLLETYIGHKGTVYSIDMSPDGSKILTSSRDNTAKLWDSESGDLIRTFSGHENDVFDAHFSPDGQSIVTASGDKTAKLWSINGELKRTFYGHQDYVRKAIFSPDNTHVLTGDDAGKVKLWQLAKR